MSIKDFVSTIWSKTAEPMIESYATELTDILYLDKQLKEKVHSHLLKKYGNEVYYNDLDGYLTTNNVLDLLIKAIRGESSIQPRIERQFKHENTRRFLEYNPKYKRQKVIVSRIQAIFGEIFNIVFTSLMSLNPHSDLGKLQRTMEMSTESVLDSQHVLGSKIDKLLEVAQRAQPLLSSDGIAETATEGIGKYPEAVIQITDKIKDIEQQYQKKHRFNEALSHYFGLLQSVATTLVGHPKEQVNTVICTLYCNIALCQSNLGLSSKALESLSAIPADTASKSKVYHLVSALVHVERNDISNYDIALNHVNDALEIDPLYHNAFAVRQFLLVHLYPEKAHDALIEMETHYSDVLSEGTDRGNIAEYYQFHGLLNLHADRYSEAIEDFKHAECYGYDPVYTKMNIAVSLYSEATATIPKGQRLIAPSVNQGIMMNVVAILKEMIDFLKGNSDYDDVRKRSIALYTSACASIGKKHELSPIDDYIYEGQPYEDLRSILLGTSETLTDAHLSLLLPEDQQYCTVRSMMDSEKADDCMKYIIALIQEDTESISPPVFHALLQICLITKSSADYWKYRAAAEEHGIPAPLLETMDACAYELDGDFTKAKALFDKIAISSVDDGILENTLRFYFRHDHSDDVRSLLLRMHELIVSGSMYISNVEAFYAETNRFFIARKDPIIEKILSELPSHLISSNCRLQLFASYFSAIYNSKELFNCLTELACASGEFPNAYTTALCAARLFRYDEALNICYALEKRTDNKDDRVRLFWLISDILLLKNDLDDSFTWAKKAHELTITNPYDLSHQAFFARAFRCHHQEALSDILEYKEEHPVVVDWLHKFSIPETGEDVVSCIKNALEEFAPDHASYMEQEKEIARLYKLGIVPVNMVLKRYNGDIFRLFSFASDNKLNIAHGDYRRLMDECDKIGESIVVDSLTLVLLASHGCLSVLDGFSRVYVNFRSVATIQQQFLGYGFSCLSDVLTWFQQSKNVILKPDGFIDEASDIAEMFSLDFVACCNIASTYNVSYLYCDSTASTFQRIPRLGFAPDVVFISIPAACYKVFASEEEKLNDVLFNLLKDTTFVNFDAETILQQIRKENYHVSSELVAPFMICTTKCNMKSFANVYLSAIKALTNECPEAAVALACIVLEDAFKIWKRGTYHRLLLETNPNALVEYTVGAISEYVQSILKGMEELFPVLPDELVTSFNIVSNKSGYTKE